MLEYSNQTIYYNLITNVTTDQEGMKEYEKVKQAKIEAKYARRELLEKALRSDF